MPRDWKPGYWNRKRARASERGRKMARARWDRDRSRRARLAELTAEQCPREIVRRIVVIDREREVREAVFWSWDSVRECGRKLRAVLGDAAGSATEVARERPGKAGKGGGRLDKVPRPPANDGV